MAVDEIEKARDCGELSIPETGVSQYM
jgi:hypothetical protein